ncbi:MAG: class I SAM-dependent methyltransferase [Verrucomicrobiota bacterium]
MQHGWIISVSGIRMLQEWVRYENESTEMGTLDFVSQWCKRSLNRNGRVFRVLRALKHPRETIKSTRRKLSKSSIFFEEGELFMCSLFPEPLLNEVISIFCPQSVLDIGCGTGKSLDYFLSRGISAQGVEGSVLAISRAKNHSAILQWDLNTELNLHAQFDVVWCFEVAEHIHPDYVHNFMKTLTNHSATIFISAAHPGQGGEGHFNEQPRSYWVDLFRRYGYHENKESNSKLQAVWNWNPENLFIFQADQKA